MKHQETKITVRVADLTRLCTSNQKAIEELAEKAILLAQNLNTQTFRLMVTERLMKEKLGITPDEIMTAGLEAIEDDRRQREAELEKANSRDGAGTATAEQALETATEEPRHTGAATSRESAESALPDGVACPPPRRQQSIPRSLQTQ